ncbi:Uncharacterized protein APZ42_026144 [Daphnia magna]|uniref:RNA-directed DNA polymerase n=1 Tax=Daphnia magna TaxID=35525 RepID=A0A164SG63_9CRUS|nr:Uncharacterized protein APZ42_026144 [Daphnia magna]
MRRYANRIRKAFHKAYPMDGILDSATAASREQMMMDRFLEGLPSDVQVPLKYKKFASFETLIDRAELTALAIEESQTRVRIHAAYSSTNAPTHQNELTSVLEALNRLSTKVDQNATTHNAELQQSLAEMKRQLAQRPSQMTSSSIIFSKTPLEHISNLRKIFDLLEEANLKVKLSKCRFLETSVQYLGHVISADDVAPDPAKIESLGNYRKPLTVKEMQSFLGLASYYRLFIKGFSTVAHPLIHQAKGEPQDRIKWGPAEEKSFKFLRKCLMTDLVLAYPDFTKEFLIYTDASDYGLGAVLSQILDGKDQPIAYASRHLIKQKPIRTATEEDDAILREQKKDSLGMDITNYLEHGTLSEENTDQIWAKEIELYGIAGGLLCRTQEPISKKRRRFVQQQVVVPFSLRKQLLYEYHDSPLSGHLAYQRTCLRIRDKYYWPTMLSDVNEYCLACKPCALQRRSNLRAFLNPLDLTSGPFEVLGLDFLGPIQPQSLQGNNHILVITD